MSVSFLVRVCGAAVALLLWVPSAFALRVSVSPARIAPGDAFLVTVRGVPGPAPAVSIGERSFPAATCGPGCYAAVGSLDLHTRPGRYRIVIAAGKHTKSLRLDVTRAAFPTLHLRLPEEKVSPSEEDLTRIREEAERLKEMTDAVSMKAWDEGFVMPLDSAVSTVYGTKRIFNGSRESIHRGIDLRGGEGDPVRASNQGTVVMASDLFFGGNTLVVDHGMGIFSIYMHLSGFALKPGDAVQKGEVVGYVGSTGRASGPHLHFGIKVLGISTNPASLLKLRL